ncbi:methylated-DNA--[protein]-cysteine S-methyltransferase [Salinivibrio sp. AR640]|uniref:methylated-DNA--[protein]-cysteine S-methyltransferase n=1 Tax=Salinivibrio sp. AR640 TaxID=1909437 RepID=UPI000986FD64|nr:methylated-DNA--[protein]-cysteine S-methyltransferase [Salinivibrio sp. AR640]OOE91565.1 hypothetical protein BZG75_10575 [Salinivibrio sp. AR640]
MPVIRYPSPLGMLTLEADTNGLTGLYLPRRAPSSSAASIAPDGDPILDEACRQLDQYFAGKRQAFSLPLAPHGTSFQRRVWAALQTIPYGHTASYQTISNVIGNPKANQAVGGANGKNPISIIIPCHRIIGRQGQLIGYGGGLAAKQALLIWEATGEWPTTLPSPQSGKEKAFGA